jgi:hypothetical protein
MTHEQFFYWLQGYLEAKPYLDIAEKIQEKIREVQMPKDWHWPSRSTTTSGYRL